MKGKRLDDVLEVGARLKLKYRATGENLLYADVSLHPEYTLQVDERLAAALRDLENDDFTAFIKEAQLKIIQSKAT